MMEPQDLQFSLLKQIDSSSDLRKLSEEQLPELAKEIRNYMIYQLNQCGGHFGASMGVVELTIALHYIYNTPDDRLVWDVGHQAYIHKILTGRRDLLHTVKQTDGLAPFPKREESEYDTFGVGHSSTSISAALGMAVAAQLDNSDRKSVAIIGDGGLTGGMALEALNHGGDIDPNILVILNDNDMSISENVGALGKHLARIMAGGVYSSIREHSKKMLEKVPPLSQLVKKTESHLKGMMAPSSIFEELGFHYVGPIDGHDLPTLLNTLKTLRPLKGAKLLHVITKKGKGYAPAEAAQIQYHAVKPGFYDKDNSQSNTELDCTQRDTTPTYSQVFGDWLCDTAAIDKQLVAVTPAMCEGSGMVDYAKQFPQRYFDVAIAEQHCVTFAAGLACEGKKPVVAIYSTFLQRAYDQLIHDVAIQNLDVTFAIDRAGNVGGDNPTHTGNLDLSYLRCVPNMIVMAPADENECHQLLNTAYQYEGPAAVRYPRGKGPGIAIERNSQTIPIGTALKKRTGKDVAILSFGNMLTPALEAAAILNATVINMRFIKPLDEALIRDIAQTHSLIVTIEDNVVMGGAGSAVGEFLARDNISVSLLQLGLPDYYLAHGGVNDIYAECGLDATGIVRSIQQRLAAVEETQMQLETV